MTGLTVDGSKHEYLDDMQTRYSKMAESAKAYVITQYGLSCFESTENGLQARTFNFYTFPLPHGSYNRRFLCDASSLTFLAEHGFDFNTCIKRGVPFMPIRTRDWQLQQVRRSSEPRSNTVVVTSDEDKAFVADLVQLITEWLAGSTPSSDSMGAVVAAAGAASGDEQEELEDSGSADAAALTQQQQEEQLLLPPMNSFKRLLAYQELRKPQFGVANHPGFWVKKLDDPRHLLLVRASPEQCEQLEAAARAARLQAVHDAAGFAAVFDGMRRSGKPGVGHNCMLDVAYGLYSFADPFLPATWRDYKKMVKAYHLGGLYDTKHLARQLPEVFGGNTSLSEVYTLLSQPGVEQLPAVQQLLAAASEAAGVPVLLPAVSHAPGYDKYRHLKPGEAAHEAGYDAFMTGAAFARLLPLIQGKIAAEPNSELGQAYAKMMQQKADAEAAKAAEDAKAAAVAATIKQEDSQEQQQTPQQQASVKQEDNQQQQQQQQHEEADLLQFVRCVCGRLNMSLTDMAYAALLEDDPIPHRPTTFHITGLAGGWRPDELLRQLQRAGLGQVRVTVLDSSSCLAQFKEEHVAAVPQTIAELDSSMVVTPWAEYALQRYHRLMPENGNGAAAAATAGGSRAAKRPRIEEGAVKQEQPADGAADMDVYGGNADGQDSGSRSRCSIM